MTTIAPRRYVWQGLEYPTMEVLTVTPGDYGAHARGLIVGLWDGQPISYTYLVEYNLLGEVARLAWDSGELTQREPGWWVDDTGADRPEFETCRTVDIRQTPFTNTLAILYAELGTGMSLDVPLIHVDLVTNRLALAVQRYTALEWTPAGARYRFRQGDFEAELATDGDAVVMDYPGLFRRIYPQKERDR